jgi:hypothetical protein
MATLYMQRRRALLLSQRCSGGERNSDEGGVRQAAAGVCVSTAPSTPPPSGPTVTVGGWVPQPEVVAALHVAPSITETVPGDPCSRT